MSYSLQWLRGVLDCQIIGIVADWWLATSKSDVRDVNQLIIAKMSVRKDSGCC